MFERYARFASLHAFLASFITMADSRNNSYFRTAAIAAVAAVGVAGIVWALSGTAADEPAEATAPAVEEIPAEEEKPVSRRVSLARAEHGAWRYR